jgi:ribosomal protein L40E
MPEVRTSGRVLAALLVLALCFALVYAEKTCPSCGTVNSDDAKFCKKCGAKLLESGPGRPVTPRLSGHASVELGVATITSDPSGADVYVDGRLRGRTPLQLADLAPGRHELRITRAGYRDYAGVVAVTGRYGAVVVTSDPVGAEMLLDGAVQGSTTESGLPLARVLYGRHTLTARMPGYRDVEKTIDLKSAGPVAVNFRLGYGKGFLSVESDPPGAKVQSQDRLLGSTPLLGELDPARYTLTVTRPGFYDWLGYAQVQFAETARVFATLERVKTRKLVFLVAGLAGVAGGAFSVLMGESEYAKYQSAATRQESERHRASTQTWDAGRDIAAGFGALMVGAYFTVRW